MLPEILITRDSCLFVCVSFQTSTQPTDCKSPLTLPPNQWKSPTTDPTYRYFEELNYERVLDIYEAETASGVVVSVGGQLPQNIALKLQESGGATVLGTDPKDIDKAEDRKKFSEILDSIGYVVSCLLLASLECRHALPFTLLPAPFRC